MIYCMAATISWALVFGPIAGDSVVGQPHAVSCFSDKWVCDSAAIAANQAFYETGWGAGHKASCEQQPAAPTGVLGGPSIWTPAR